MVRPASRTKRNSCQKVIYTHAMMRDMSIKELADRMYMTPSNLYMKLRRNALKFDDVARIAKVFGMEPMDLMRELVNAKAQKGGAA